MWTRTFSTLKLCEFLIKSEEIDQKDNWISKEFLVFRVFFAVQLWETPCLPRPPWFRSPLPWEALGKSLRNRHGCGLCIFFPSQSGHLNLRSLSSLDIVIPGLNSSTDVQARINAGESIHIIRGTKGESLTKMPILYLWFSVGPGSRRYTYGLSWRKDRSYPIKVSHVGEAWEEDISRCLAEL